MQTQWTQADHAAMRMALEAASRGMGRTWPNPLVGAVIMDRRGWVGAGWHRCFGARHAEIEALQKAGSRARGATLYVNLEPCSHFGKTPPCAPAVVKAGIRRVVVAMQDPNPLVSGRGLKFLRRAGLQVQTGLLRNEAEQLNEVFIKRITTGLPFVVCKAAVSLDGKIACVSGDSRWISGPKALKHAHQLRALADAVIVGAGTLRQDHPRLLPRLARRVNPGPLYRVVLEGKTPLNPEDRLPPAADHSPVVIATARQRRSVWQGLRGIEVWQLPAKNGRISWPALLRKLARIGANYVLVEGGGEVHADFLGLARQGTPVLADQIQFILAPRLIGGRKAPGPIGGHGAPNLQMALRLQDPEYSPLGRDMLVKASVK